MNGADEPAKPVPIAKILRTQLLVLACAQVFLLLIAFAEPNDGHLGRLGFMLASLLYLAIHGGILGIVVLVRFFQGRAPEGAAYLATMGIILVVGGGTCFVVGN